MSYDQNIKRPRTGETPAGRSPQRVIQRPRVPDPTWSRAVAKAQRLNVPIGHVIAELLEEWIEEDETHERD